jgi:PIN domain nuclease of toxin-antitoxin system
VKAFLADTSALLYASESSGRLGRESRRIFDELAAGSAALRLWASTTSLYEAWLLERGGKIRLSLSLGLWHRRVESAGVGFLPIVPEDVLEARALDWDHRDAHDRLIVATALRLGVPLVTNDRAIRDWNGVATVW